MSRFSAELLARALASVRSPPEEPVETVDYEQLAVEICARLCRRFEGFYAHPYLCPAGVATIGYGATHYLDGRKVKLSDPPISKEAAEGLLLDQIRRVYLPATMKLCPKVREPKRLAALTDFCFNLGAGNLTVSTLRKRVNSGAWDQAKVELMKWVYAAGKKLRGLMARRSAEADLI